MNKGLKSTNTFVSLSCSNLATSNININNTDANLIIEYPLFKTLGNSEYSLSLFYNYQRRNIDDIFGKGIRLNFFSKLNIYPDYMILDSADGASYKYVKQDDSNIFFNIETSSTISYITSGAVSPYYELKDKYGNRSRYNNYNYNYPYEIIKTNQDRYYMNRSLDSMMIHNFKGDEVTFVSSNNLITSIIYNKNNLEFNRIELVYDSNRRLTKIVNKRNGTTLSSLTITYTDTSISLHDNISSYRLRFNLSGDKVISVNESYTDSFENNPILLVNYYIDKTILIDYKGNKDYYYFDNDGYLKFKIDSNLNYSEYDFNKELDKLVYQSNIISNNDETIEDIDINSFEDDNIIISGPYEVSEDPFNHIIDEIYEIRGNGTLTYELNTEGLGITNALLSLWYKALNGNISIKLEGQDIDEGKLDSNSLSLYTLGIGSALSINKIKITITLSNNGILYLGSIKLLNKRYGISYIYDNIVNLIETNNGSLSTSRKYNRSNLLLSYIDFRSHTASYNYDNLNRLTKATLPNNVEQSLEYDDNSNLISRVTSNKDISIPEGYDYDLNGKLIQSTDMFGGVSRYSYDFMEVLNHILIP